MASAQDKELQEMAMIETQRAQLWAQMSRLTDTCWDKCIDKPRDKLDYKQESCLTNCVERYIDTSVAITQLFRNKLQKQLH